MSLAGIFFPPPCCGSVSPHRHAVAMETRRRGLSRPHLALSGFSSVTSWTLGLPALPPPHPLSWLHHTVSSQGSPSLSPAFLSQAPPSRVWGGVCLWFFEVFVEPRVIPAVHASGMTLTPAASFNKCASNVRLNLKFPSTNPNSMPL